MRDWTFKGFDAEFDQHVRAQLPWYDLATEAVSLIARHYIPKGGRIYDIGASTGNIGRALAETVESRGAQLIALDNCPDMVKAYNAPGECLQAEAQAFAYEPFDVAVLFLTLMFMPVADCRQFVADLRAKMKPGGAIIVFDKCVSAGGYEATVLARMTWYGKMQAGVSPAEIAEKEIMLAGVQRPIHTKELGKGALEVFRFADFAGWLIVAS